MSYLNADVSTGDSISPRMFDTSLSNSKKVSSAGVMSSFARQNVNLPASRKTADQGYLSFNYKV